MASEPTQHLATALKSHRDASQDLQDGIAAREAAGQPFAADIGAAQGALQDCGADVDRLLAARQADDAYRAADLQVTFLTGALAVEDAAVKAQAISLRQADIIKGNVDLEGYAVRPRVAKGIEITNAAEFAQQVEDKLPALLDVLAPRTPSPKVVKEHAATLEKLEVSGWQRTAKITATFAPLEPAP